MKALQAACLAGLALRNRIAVAPMSRMQAHQDGRPAADAAAYYARYASHGAALMITEAIYTDDIAAKAYFNQPGLTNPAHTAAWRKVTTAVHEHGGKIFAQLQHAGKLAEPGLNMRHIGPVDGAAVGLTWQTGSPNAFAHSATPEDIENVVQGFESSARNALEAGFDGVEIHGARGYLVNDFLSSYNQRQDRWGGSLENRLRLPVLILEKVRSAIGTLPLSFNYSIYKMDDYAYQPAGGKEEIAYILAALRRAGADILHISARRTLRAEAWGLSLANTAEQFAPGPLIANGGLASLEDCEMALATTGAAVLSLARPFLANADWLERSLAGKELKSYAPGMERLPLLG